MKGPIWATAVATTLLFAGAAWAGGDRDSGQLEIRSPNVYGQVWVNGKKLGYVPVLAKKIKGTAVVEVRVDDVTRRAKGIDIVAGQRTQLVLLSARRALAIGPKKQTRVVKLYRVRKVARR